MKARELTLDDLEPGEIEILRLGEHHGAEQDLTLDDFETIVRDYEPASRHQATAVIDHDLREPTDPARKGINHGLIDRVRRVKDSVVARFAGVTEELRTLVNSGRLHAVTPELYRRFRGTDRMHLRCVAFVGADTPAQKGLLRPVFLSEGEGLIALPLATPVRRFAEDLTEGAPNMGTNPNPSGDPKPTPSPSPTPPAPAPAPTPPAPTPTGDPSAPTPGSSAAPAPAGGTIQLAEVQRVVGEAVNAAVAPLREQVSTLTSRLESVDPEFGDHAIVAFAEELVRDGKIEGKDKDRTIARAKLLRGQTIMLGEKRVPALADFMEQERGRQPLAHFQNLDVPVPKSGAPTVRDGVLSFAEGEGPGFTIIVPKDASDADVARLKKLAAWSKGRGFKSFGEAAPAFEREAEGVHA